METKLKIGKYRIKVDVVKNGEKLYIYSPYNKNLIDEIKALEGAKWHGYDEDNPQKVWSITDSPHNQFQLAYLQEENPYYDYEKPLLPYKSKRQGLYHHQIELIQHGLTRKQCIFAAEPGTGKTLAAIEVIEASGKSDWIWVGPKSALYSVMLEFRKWDAKITPRFYTYEGLKKLVESPQKTPQGVVFDESSRLKNPTAQRTQAARHLADAIRKEDGYVILMSGSPAPRNPVDWWSQCEISCPGFLKEGNTVKFKQRLAIVQKKESNVGGIYPQLFSWKDDEKKCSKCGEYEDHYNHDAFMMGNDNYHVFQKSKNEVAYLYDRMEGLVLVKTKATCLDLPDKIFRIIECKPTQEILNAAKLIVKSTPRTIEALTLLRELSDGFQYEEKEIKEEQTCPLCKGSRTIPFSINPQEISTEDAENNQNKIQACPKCSGTGKIRKRIRETIQFACPKEEALRDLLDEYSESGRIVIYAGFTGSIDRCNSIVTSCGWDYIKVDGRGFVSNLSGGPTDLLSIFQSKEKEKVAFIGQPGAGGLGLNLTASPIIVYYSNDFNAESRIQSMDRIHRIGMDTNKGATIIDLIHLPTDTKVLENLNKKQRLQDISMGDLEKCLSIHS